MKFFTQDGATVTRDGEPVDRPVREGGMTFFPNLDTEEGRTLAAQQGDLREPAPATPEVAAWRRGFASALAAGDQASAVQTNTEYDYSKHEHVTKEPFPEAMYDFHIGGGDTHNGRIAWAQAQYLRALAAATGQSVAEVHDLVLKVDTLGDRLADPLNQIAAWACDASDTQDRMLGALELIAGALTAANVRADLAESKATIERESGREAELAKLRRNAELVRDLRTNLDALAWWQWLRRRNIRRHLSDVALDLVK